MPEIARLLARVRPAPRRLACALAGLVLLTPAAAGAAEDLPGPAAPLEVPGRTDADPAREFLMLEIASVRGEMERAVDLVLCEALMRQAGAWPTDPPAVDANGQPRDFAEPDCTPAFEQQVASNDGFLHWRSTGARFTQCTDPFCFGRPYMSASEHVDQPNLIEARLSAHLALTVEPEETIPIPNDRDITIPLDLTFRCAVPGGGAKGVFQFSVRTGPAAISGPGAIESVLDFLTPFNISARTTSGIRAALDPIPLRTGTSVDCSSIGVFLNDDPDALPEGHRLHGVLDAIIFDPPAASRRPPLADVAGLGRLVTVELLGVTRNPLPALVSPDHAGPGRPEAGQFVLFLNGAPVVLPPDGLDLPPEGGHAGINFCKTVEVANRERFQIIFANGLGGAVWSEFVRGGDFGSGPIRRMTTYRRILVPAPTVPDVNPPPGLGSAGGAGGPPGSSHPVPVDLREFELLYRVRFTAPPDEAIDSAVSGAGGGGVTDGTVGPLGDNPVVADPDRPAAQACQEL